MTVQMLPHDAHDARLIDQTHPADWVNPKPAPMYNLVVIGGGTAGLVTAAGAAGLGAKVALIEKDLLGGDCLTAGCVPSKALIRAARAAAHVRDAGRLGVRVPDGWHVDFPAVMERMRRIRADLSPHDSVTRFQGLGVDVFLGAGKFAGPDVVDVGGVTLRFQKAVIASGARAGSPEIPGLADAGFLTNESIFALTELPRRLAVIGAGPIGCELAQAFARFGSKVTLLANHEHILPKEEPEAAKRIEQAFERDGITIIHNCTVTKVERRTSDRALSLSQRGTTRELVADALLIGSGRVPNVDGLNLEGIDVAFDRKHGVIVDDQLRTTNPRIYAAGDVCSRFKFTHAADAMARIVIQNALFMGRSRLSTLTVPWCTYTDPEIAHVGLYEHDARAHGIGYRVFVQELNRVDRAVIDGEEEGFVQILVDPKDDTILGATVVAAHAGELISEITLAMVGKLGLKTIAKTIHPYPTQGEAIRKLGDAYNRTRLTPLVKWLFDKWLSWGR